MTAAGCSIARWDARLGTAGDVALLDIRDPVEFERGHIPGATSLPRRRIEFRIAELVADGTTPIAIYGDADARAELAADTLARLGYACVEWLAGGIEAWRAAGRALASGTNVPSKRFGERVQHECAVPSIDAATLKHWQAEGRQVAICDVRTPQEHAQACIPHAVSVPSFDIALHAADLAEGAATLVLHCAGRTRSIIATQTLREMGIDRVVALENGSMGWALAGLALTHGSRAVPRPPSRGSRAVAERKAAALALDAGVRRIDPLSLSALLAASGRNRHVFDVRSLSEYEAGHIEGSTALPGGQAVQRADDFIPLRTAAVVLLDEDEARANLTGVWLRRMGFSDVAVLAGGLRAWRASGGLLATGRGRSLAPRGEAAASSMSVAACLEWRRAHPDGLVVDVDTSGSFRRGHLAGSHWLARGWLEPRIGALVPSTGHPLLLTCAAGRQAPLATTALERMGYARVAWLQGGKQAWEAAGQALCTSELGPQDDELLAPYERGEQAMRDYIDWEKLLVQPAAAPERPVPPPTDFTERQR